MKKSNLMWLLCFMIFTQLSYAQKITSARIFYNVEVMLPPDYLEIVNKNDLISESSRALAIDSYHMNKTVSAVLEFKGSESYYKVSEDDVYKNENRNLSGLNFSFILAAGVNYIYYSNVLEKRQFYQGKNLGMQDELVSFEKFKWKLTQGKSVILGFACKKAQVVIEENNKRKIVVAWYTEEIPFSFGPKHYSGLPGLILKIEKGNNSFVASKIEINPKNVEFIKPTAKIKTTLKAKRKAFQKFMSEN